MCESENQPAAAGKQVLFFLSFFLFFSIEISLDANKYYSTTFLLTKNGLALCGLPSVT